MEVSWFCGGNDGSSKYSGIEQLATDTGPLPDENWWALFYNIQIVTVQNTTTF